MSLNRSLSCTLFTVACLVFMLSGCGSKQGFVILDPAEDGTIGAIRIETEKGATVLEEQGKAVYLSDRDTPPSEPTPVDMQAMDATFRDAMELKPTPPATYLLYFRFNSPTLTTESLPLIDQILRTARERKSSDIQLIGHTDRTGEEEYNRSLSLKRARAVATILAERGIPQSSMSIDYHGEGNPLVETADNVAEPRNRRVEVVIR